MQRVLGVAVVILMAVVIFEAIALRRIRVELAAARGLAAALDLEARSEEIGRAGNWLHAWLQSPEGGGHAAGLCPSGSPDIDRISRLLFGTYLQARAAGVGEAEARGWSQPQHGADKWNQGVVCHQLAAFIKAAASIG